jgi:hypothetical protein
VQQGKASGPNDGIVDVESKSKEVNKKEIKGIL